MLKFVTFWLISHALAQDTHVTLNQGTIIGLKVFPETSRTPVYTFLGIPYAEPPIGNRRFLRPRPHGGWNHTYFARDVKPICPQPQNSIYDEKDSSQVASNIPMSENCLFLNVWTPEAGLRYGNLPVLVILTGDEMTFDWSQNRPTGLDLASENIVVVNIQYRSNVFGFLALNGSSLSGNYGIYDQQLGLKWIQQNIDKFGGNPKQVTLLGHGTTGAYSTFIHMSNPRSEGLFSKAIIMSGSFYDQRIHDPTLTNEISKSIVKKLGCYSRRSFYIVNCLNEKSTGDIQQAFESIYSFSNSSKILTPIIEKDSQIPEEPYILTNFQEAIESGKFRKIPMLIGICSNEGAFGRDFWIDLARKNYSILNDYVNSTIIPEVLNKNYGSYSTHPQIIKTIKWKYFEQFPKSASYLLNAMQRLISEAEYENSFYKVLETLAKTYSNGSQAESGNLFAYVFQISNSMDMRGKVNLFGGASHSSDLPLLMGPSLFQQIARRRFSPSEDKLCKKMRQLFTDFMKTGNPTPGRIYDAWLPYTINRKHIKIIGEKLETGKSLSLSQFEENLPIIEEMLKMNAGLIQPPPNSQMQQNPYILSTNAEDFSSRMARTSYLANKQDYEYFHHLKKVYSFWNVLLPSIYAGISAGRQKKDNDLLERNEREISFLEHDSLRYKHAFFAMLGLVCFLLAVLGICIYVIKRNYDANGTTL